MFKSRRHHKAVIALSCLPLLASCADRSVVSTPISGHSLEERTAGRSSVQGVPYSLPIGMMKLKVELDANNVFKVTGPSVINFPQRDRTFFLTYKPSPFASDEVLFGVDDKGLLQTVNSTTEDRSPEIVSKITEIATDLVLSGVPKLTEAADAPATGSAKPFQREFFLDPLKLVNKAPLRRNGVTLAVTDLAPGSGTAIHTPVWPAPNPDARQGSVHFRLLRPLLVTLTYERVNYSATFGIVVPDPDQEVTLDIRRAPCIKNLTELTFAAGSLQTVKFEKPSEVLGCLAIPSTAIKAVLGLPTAIDGRKSTLLQSQKDVLAAQTALLKAEADLVAAKSLKTD